MLFNIPEIPVVVITVGPVAALMQNPLAARPWITPVVMERPSDLGLAFGQLRSLGIERISCIGGRRIATQLIDAGLVQDLYLTTSPRTGGEPNTPMYPQAARRPRPRPQVRDRNRGRRHVRTYIPDRPPLLNIRRMSPITIALSTALTMS